MKPGRRRLLGALLAGAALAACSRSPRLPPLPAGSAVLAFGDSVTHGTGAGEGEDWPTRLADLSGWRIVNAGIPGDTAAAGKLRIAALVTELQPALVIVEIGGNDFLRRRQPAAVKEDLRQIVRQVQAGGAQVVLVAVPELSLLGIAARHPSDAAIYQELADEEKVALVPEVFADILAQPALCADQIHPNAEGYRQLAAGIAARLREIGLL